MGRILDLPEFIPNTYHDFYPGYNFNVLQVCTCQAAQLTASCTVAQMHVFRTLSSESTVFMKYDLPYVPWHSWQDSTLSPMWDHKRGPKDPFQSLAPIANSGTLQAVLPRARRECNRQMIVRGQPKHCNSCQLEGTRIPLASKLLFW